MITKVTINMERMAVNSNVGMPKAKKLGNCNHAPSATLEKSPKPIKPAIMLPNTIDSRMDKRRTVALRDKFSKITIAKVISAKLTFSALPQFSVFLLPPIIQRTATGSKDRPMMVITQPVTTGGKNRIILEK